jgi:hypothetical protein
VALSILEMNQKRLACCRDDGEAMQTLCNYLSGIYNEEFEQSELYKDGDKINKVKIRQTFFLKYCFWNLKFIITLI